MMRFGLGSVLLGMACICLFCAWYTERSSFNSAKEQWQAERMDLIQAGALVGERKARMEQIKPDMMFNSDGELYKYYAAQNLITTINVQNQWVEALGASGNRSPEEIIERETRFYWRKAGKPSFEELKKRFGDSLPQIKRPEALKQLITKWNNDSP